MYREDSDFVLEYRAGDERAFEMLLLRYLKPVYNFSYRFLGNQDDAEDVVQDIFLKAWTHLSKFRIGESFRAWIFTIARNSIIDCIRKKRNVPLSAFENESGVNHLLENSIDPAPLPDELFANTELKAILEKALSLLSPVYREVVLLRYDGDCTFEEIGVILGKPLDTVKSQHRRALIELRKHLSAPK